MSDASPRPSATPDSGSAPRLAHRHPRLLPHAAPDEHEPLDTMPPGVGTTFLAVIDRAIDRGDLDAAMRIERLLPADLGSDPAVVDRLATLRLLEGDLATARAALGAAPRSSPRLAFLRAIIDLHDGRMSQAEARLAEARGPGSPTASPCLLSQILTDLLAATEAIPSGYRLRTEAACRGGRSASSVAEGPDAGPAALGRALRTLHQLLARSSPEATLAGFLARAIGSAAADLGADLPTRPADRGASSEAGLAVTTADRDRILRRAA